MDAIEKIAIWSAEMEDQAGATAGLLKALSNAGADLQFALARRQPDKPGKGARVLATLRAAGINLIGVSAFPEGTRKIPIRPHPAR